MHFFNKLHDLSLLKKKLTFTKITNLNFAAP